jgi:hypothetical protein
MMQEMRPDFQQIPLHQVPILLRVALRALSREQEFNRLLDLSRLDPAGSGGEWRVRKVQGGSKSKTQEARRGTP